MSHSHRKQDKSPSVRAGTNELAAGFHIGERFELLQKLGEGSIGEVWLAKDGHLDEEQVALKILRSDLSKTLNKTILRALSKSPLKRFATCTDFYNAFALAVGKAPEQDSGAHARVLDDQNRDTIVLNKVSFSTRKTRLGRLLVDAGVITQLELMDALIHQNKEDLKLGQALVQLNFVSWEKIVETLSEQLQIPHTNLQDEDIDPSIAHTITKAMAQQYQCVPIKKSTYGVLIAVADPLNMEALNFLEEAYWNDIELRVATEENINTTIEKVYPD